MPPLPQLLLTPGDLRRVPPGAWGVRYERLWPKGGSRPAILSCDESVDVPPHLARVFLVQRPFPAPLWHGGPTLVQRLRQYPAGQARGAVNAIRAMRERCPTRARPGYSERWTVMQDSRTRNGDVLWLRRTPLTPDPRLGDFGSDWLVVRNRDVVTMVESIRGGWNAPDSSTHALLRQLRQRTCPDGAC